MKGFWKKIFRVNLSDHTVREEILDEDLLRSYLGGRGLGGWFVSQEVPPETDPLGPQNKMFLFTGPLTGSAVPTAGRFSVSALSPLTETICDSNSGGSFGAFLKRAGIDGLAIEGVSEKPVYLSVTGEGVTFHEASHLWGKDCPSTRDAIVEEQGGKVRVASIGPAGEKGVLFAAIMNDNDRAAGRGGMGAVMGSKNLKAIAVQGTQKTEVADPDLLDLWVKRATKTIDKNPVTGKSLQILGTSVLVNIINAHGMYPTHNFQRGVFNNAEGSSGEKIAETILQKRSGCYRCPIQCGRVTKTSQEDGEGPEYETAWAFSAQCGVKDLEAVAHANYRCNRLGMDTISMGNTIGCAMELYEKGALDEPLHFGDAETMVQLVEDTAYRRGFGDKLALGSYRLAKMYQREDLSMSVKKMELPAYDPRGAQGHALSYATSNRGGCHMRAYIISSEILGHPVFLDRYKTSGKPHIVSLMQNISATVDSLVLCRFTQIALGVDYYASFLSAVTGESFSEEEVIEIGERIYTLERWYNSLRHFGRHDDNLPQRFLEESLHEGSSRNRLVLLDEMLDQYYQLKGWDNNGVPTPQTLERLGISSPG